MAKRGKYITQKDSVSGALESGCSDLEGLTEEMREWADNLEGGGLENTAKYESVSETADTLENHEWGEIASNVIEACNAVPELDEKLGEEVEYDEFRLYGKKAGSESRADRCSNAVGAIEVALSELESACDDAETRIAEARKALDDDDESESAKLDEQEEALQEARDTIQEARDAIDEAQGVEFPGMYG